MDFLKSAVASAISKGPLGAYSIGDKVDVDNSVWTLNNATKRENNSKCSIFTFDIAPNRGRLPIARNAVRKARTLHHPGVIKVVDTVETDSQISIVTERVAPLTWFTKRKSLGEETMKWGLYGVARTVKFINDDAASVHGCVRSSSIFVSDSGEWKIGAFDLLSSMKEDDAVIYTYSSLAPDLGRILPPEVQGGSWDSIKKNPTSATDSFQFGLLCHECFSGSFVTAEQAVQAKAVPQDMQPAWRRLLNPNPKTRMSTSNFIEQGRRAGGFFNSVLINLSEGVDKLGLMSEAERDEFFGQLEEISSEFPEEYMRHKILPELIKSVEFGGGGPKVFRVVMQIGQHLEEDEYERMLTPVIIRLFASPDRAMRVCLLENLSLMIDHLSPKLVNDKIFPNLVTGFTDQAPVLREQTVKCVLTIVNKLSERTVNGELLRYLAKTANDAEPGIRTNTTICLGKIAKNLSKTTRSKVLVAAFTRSLRDPFVHARNAALLALAATGETFTDEDAAGKVLPALCPSLVDKERLVRDQANKTVDVYLARIRKYAASLPETALPPATAPNGVPATGKPGVLPTDTGSWAGWAISSFTNKLGAADGEIAPKPATPTPPSVVLTPGAAPARPAGTPLASRSTSSASVAKLGATPVQAQPSAAPPPLSRSATDTTKLAASFSAPEITANDDFWGSIDDEQPGDNDDDDWAPAPSPAPAQSPAPTANGSKPLTPSFAPAPAAGAAGGEPDFAAWLNAQGGAKAARPAPKGVSGGAAKKTGKAGTGGGIVGGAAKKKAAPRVVQRPVEADAAPSPTPEPQPEAKKAATVPEKKDDDWGDDW